MTAYTVVEYENGRRLEWGHTVESKAKTPAGFLRLFYAQFPRAPRGCFAAVLEPAGAAVYFGVMLSCRFVEA